MERRRQVRNLGRHIKLRPLIILGFSVLLLLCPASLWAKPVSVREAEKVVRGWLKADAQPLGTGLGQHIMSVETFSDDDGQTTYYAVYLQPSGFVIVPGDDLVEPIICFAPVGRYDPSKDNPLGALVSRDVLAWEVSVTLESEFCVSALEQALNFGRPEIFNTDQGSQFTSIDFTKILLNASVQISMDGKGRVFDNIFSERLWRTVKVEEVYLRDYQTVAEARYNLSRYFELYNNQRLHQALGYRTPAEVYGVAVGTPVALRAPSVPTALTYGGESTLKTPSFCLDNG